MRRTHYIAMTFAALGLMLGACQTKVRQCNKLTKQINAQGTIFKAEQAKLRFNTKDTKGTAEQLGRVADIFIKAGDKVAGVSLKDGTLKVHRDKWVSMVKRIGEKFHVAKKALLAKDAPTALKAFKEVSKIGKEESKIVSAINTYCSAK